MSRASYPARPVQRKRLMRTTKTRRLALVLVLATGWGCDSAVRSDKDGAITSETDGAADAGDGRAPSCIGPPEQCYLADYAMPATCQDGAWTCPPGWSSTF